MLNDWLVKRAELSPGKTALIDASSGERVTYRELDRKANALAAYLRRFNLEKGDRVAILDFNSLFHLTLLFALPRLGAIFLPLNYRLSGAELAGILKDSAPKLLFYGPDWQDAAGELAEKAPFVQAITTTEAACAAAHETLAASLSPHLDLDGEDIWMLLYTGGTTGQPKGAMLSYRMVTWNVLNTTVSWGLLPDDVVIMAMPFFHTGGLNVFTLPLITLGGTTVIMKSFDPELYLQLLEREKATIMFMVPTMYQLLAATKSFGTTDFSAVRTCISGGSPCPDNIYHLYWDKGLPFKQGYGLTEGGPNCFVLADHVIKEKIGAVGKPVFYAMARVADEEGREVPSGEIGELILAGPHLFSGYRQNPEATAATLRNGWLHTGDLARRDRDGYYYIVDRKKDMFISGGENVYPFEIESVLYSHPAVVEAAVVGIPDDRWGEVGRAYVVLRPGRQVDPKDLIAYCRQNLARYKIPKEIVITDALPKSPAGKILKRELPG